MSRFLSVIIFVVTAMAVTAENVAENVVITNANEVYTFVDTPDGVIVKVVEQTQYEAQRHSDRVMPTAFYNNSITLDKASGGKPQYRTVNAPNIFHDDSRVCYFDVELKGAGAKAKSEFKLTYKDAALFAKLQVSSGYPIAEKNIKFEIPASLSDIELIERNFPEGKVIRNEAVNPDGSRTIMFVFNNIEGWPNDASAPYPIDREPYILIKGYFKGLDELYKYHRRMLDVDTVIPDVRAVIAEAVNGATNRDSIIDNIYRYVQRKVRYVAYEEGEAGYRPDLPAEVLRKNYGDCKGMALLLATLLNRVGIEADVAAIGTKRIPYKIADVPSLGATNHMICIVPTENDTLFLDATCEYISSRDIPGGIQGKDAMMFTADGYRMVNVPVLPLERSSDVAVYEYKIVDGAITGTVEERFTGDMLESFMTMENETRKIYKDDAMAKALRPRKNAKIDRSSISTAYASPGEYVVTASLTDNGAITDVGEAMYVDMSGSFDRIVKRIDLTGRRSDLRILSRGKMVQRSLLEVPEGYKAGELPENYHADCNGVGFDCRFSLADDGRVCVEKSLDIDQQIIPRDALEQWNRTVAAWTEAAGQQIELLKQ